MTRIAFARRMSGRPFESRLLVERTLESLAAGRPEASALTLELALDHYWRGEFARMHDVAQGVLELARGAAEPLFVTWCGRAVQRGQQLARPPRRWTGCRASRG